MRVSGIIARLLALIALLAATGASWAQLADVQIRNVYRADQAIHIENGFVQSSPVQPNWQSALWKVEIVAAPYTVRLKNAWKGTYLNVEAGPVAATEAPAGWLSAQWLLEPVAGRQNTFRIKNVWKGTYLHTETGMLAIGAIQPGWTSE